MDIPSRADHDALNSRIRAVLESFYDKEPTNREVALEVARLEPEPMERLGWELSLQKLIDKVAKLRKRRLDPMIDDGETPRQLEFAGIAGALPKEFPKVGPGEDFNHPDIPWTKPHFAGSVEKWFSFVEAFRRQVAHDLKKLEIYQEFADAARKGCADDLSMSLLEALRRAFNGED